MGAQIPKAPQETQGVKIGGNAFELSRQLEALTGRPAAGFRTQATAQWKPAVSAFRANAANGNLGRRAPTVEDFLGQMLQQEQAIQRSAVRAVQSAPAGTFSPAATPVTPLPAVVAGAQTAEPGAGGPPARTDAEVQKAAEDERRRVGRQRGRGSTVLTPFDVPIPTGNIAKTVLGGRI